MSDLLAERLRDIVGAQHVTVGESAMARYPAGRKTQPPPSVDAAAIRPLVVQPGAASEIQKILRVAADLRASVVPVGTGSLGQTHVVSGRRIVLDTRRMTNVLHLDATSLLCHVQAGLTLQSLEERLDRDGLTLGDLPSETYRSTVGGVLAGRAPGRATSRLGPFENNCLGISAVLGDGRLLHDRVAPRKATGPDLSRLLIGSEGAFGIITAATLRIQRRPELRTFSSATFDGVEPALAGLRSAFSASVRPAIARIYDPDLARAIFGELTPPGRALVIAVCAGAREITEAENEVLASCLRGAGGTDAGEGPAQEFWRRRAQTLRGERAAATDAGLFPVAAPITRLLPVYRGVRSSLRAIGAEASGAFTRFFADGGSVFFRLPPGEEVERVAREAAGAAGGNPVDELFADERFRPYLRELKAILDPAGILNPGRLVSEPEGMR